MSLPDPRPSARPLLPQDDPDPGGRAAGLEVQQDTYRFVHDWPAGVATASWLPEADDYSSGYIAKSVPIYARIAANYAAVALRYGTGGRLELLEDLSRSVEKDSRLFKSMHLKGMATPKEVFGTTRPRTWRDYADIFQVFAKPAVVPRVDDDATLGDAMAWQRVAGCNPTVLARCDALPSHFPVTEADYTRAMGEGDSLEAARAEGRLYLADYGVLDGVVCGVTNGLQKYLAAPLALYAVDRSDGRLRSVCIQNGQDPTAYPRVTPADGWAWRMATQCVQVADANHHEGSAHLGRTHMVMEAVAVAMKRQLASTHPLTPLLTAHTETTLAINASAKTSLIAPGGTVDTTFAAKIRVFGDIVRGAVQSWPLDRATPRQDLEARGLLDVEALPVHPYREDALPVWDALAAFLGEYVALYYTADTAVQADGELQAFVRDLAAPDAGRLPGVPEVQTRAQLAQLLTILVFTATAQHSAVNFTQYPYMGYVPNMGGALYAPPPTGASAASEEAYLALMAPMGVALDSISMVYLLSEVRDSTLGEYGPTRFQDLRVLPLVKRFQAALRDVEQATAARDASRWLPYPYLRPSQILQSISI
ncbi:MAG: lipoxygenase [Alphaproteobacteria bacterium]|nr:lipoxygenase [Alphaproteobacteria bacterium]